MSAPEPAPGLERRAARFVEDHRLVGASVGVVIDGSLAWSRGFGWLDLDRDPRPDEHTLYRIASITKTFTATAIVQLRDEGRLRLDDPLAAHVPEFARATNPFGPIEDVTLRRLLMHHSGLMGDTPGMDDEKHFFPPTDEVLASAERIRVAIPPASAYKYSNLGFQLLGEVVARASGTPFTDYVAHHITGPLGMDATTFDPRGPLAPRVARGYDARAFSDHVPGAARLSPAGLEADGGLYSSVADLARWIAFETGRLPGSEDVLAEASRREMQRPAIIADEGWTEGQGLGWYTTRRGDTMLVGHDGELNGFSTSIRFEPRRGVGAIVLLNGVGLPDGLAFDLAEVVLDERGDAAAAARPRPSPVPETLAPYLGAYVVPEFGDRASVEWRDDRLVLLVGGERGERRELEPLGPHSFVVEGGRDAGEHLVFECDDEGRVTGMRKSGYSYVRLRTARPPRA